MALRDKLAYLCSQRWIFCMVAMLYSLGLLIIAFRDETGSLRASPSEGLSRNENSKQAVSSAITRLYQTFLLPIDAENFTGPAGQVHSLPFYDSPDQIRFTRPLRKKLLILDVDNRPLDGPGGILNSSWSHIEETDFTSVGRLSHYIYARTHGYDYKLVQVASNPRRYGTWSKVRALRQALRHYDFVVFLDADAMFPYPHIPLEWLFNYWNITAETLVALAQDPNDPINLDDQGRTLLNTGFVIAQRSTRALELLDAWDLCTDDIRFPGCSRWSYRWPHEQGAFGNYLRYAFNRADDVKVLPCIEANGSPETSLVGCSGKLVRHYWGAKAHLPAAVQESLMRYLLPLMHETFLREQRTVVLKLNGSWTD